MDAWSTANRDNLRKYRLPLFFFVTGTGSASNFDAVVKLAGLFDFEANI